MSPRTYALIHSTRQDDTLVVGLNCTRMDEAQINQLAEELLDAGLSGGCSRYVLRFGPRPVECLYSVFLAKLIKLQRTLAENKIALVLCEMHPAVLSVFDACKLTGYFLIAKTPEEAQAIRLPEPLPGQTEPPCIGRRFGGPHPGEVKA